MRDNTTETKLGNWTDEPCWYATVRDAGRTALLLGPFQAEADCRKWAYRDESDGGSALHGQLVAAAEQVDPMAWFYQYGMVRMPNGHRSGRLNEFFLPVGNTFDLQPVDDELVGRKRR